MTSCIPVEIPSVEISVVICTRNRAESLKRTLHRFSEISIPEEFPWEIVVVDNRSTDSTRSVIEEFRTGSGLNVTYVYEPEQGLSHARNRGLRETKGRIVAFTDDDIIVDTLWIAQILKESRSSGEAAMIFGRTKTYSEGTPLLSIKESDRGKWYAFPCSPWHVGHGNNMIIRRSLIESVGTFDPWLGAGTRIGAAEDTDYVYRVLRSNRKILYSPSIVVYHDHDRIDSRDVRRIERNYAKGRGAFYCKHILGGDIFAAKLFYWELRSLASVFIETREKRRKAVRNLSGLFGGLATRVLTQLRATFPIAASATREHEKRHL
jgi:glycosyltransferase involved in cell wall biosynthesis